MEKKKPTKGKFYDLEEIVSLDIPKPSFVVEGWISKGEINVVVGQPNKGKSPIGLELGLCVSKGVPFLDRKTQKLNVLVVDEENSLNLIVDRLKRMNRCFRDESSSAFYVWSSSALKITEIDIAFLRELVKEYSIEFIIFDSFARFAVGNENDVEDMKKVFSLLKPLTDELGLTVLFIHHVVKSATKITLSDVRGSGDLAAMCGSVIGVSSGKNGAITIHQLKNRHGELSAEINCKIVDVSTPDGVGLNIVQVGERNTTFSYFELARTWVLQNVQKGEIFKSGNFYKANPQFKPSILLKGIEDLAESGFIENCGKGKWIFVSNQENKGGN